MSALGFLKQKLTQGLSDVENWGGDAVNDVSSAVGSLFGTDSSPTNGNGVRPVNIAQTTGSLLTAPNQPLSNLGPNGSQDPSQPITGTPNTNVVNNSTKMNEPISMNNVKPTQSTPGLADYISPKIVGNNNVTPNDLANGNLVRQQQAAIAATNNTKQTHASVMHDLTHNVLTDAGGGAVKFIPQLAENYSNTFANLGRKAAGAPDATIQQNMGGNVVTNDVLKASGATGQNRQLASDILQTGIAGASGLVGNAVEPLITGGAAVLAPDAASELINAARLGLTGVTNGLDTAIRYGTNAGVAGVVNSGLGAAGEAGQPGAKPLDVAKAGAEGFGTGLAFGAGGTAAGDLVKTLLNKNAASSVEDLMGNKTETPPPKEVASAADIKNGFRNPDAERAAIDAYGETGDMSKAVDAYEKVTGKHDVNSLSSTATALREAKMLAPEDEVSPLGINALPVDREKSVPTLPTKENGLRKVTSLENRANHLGPEGREFVQRATNVRNESRMLYSKMKRMTPTFYDLNKEDQEKAFDVKEGNATSDDPKINKAVSELKQSTPLIKSAIDQSGLDSGNQGPSYMPHIFEDGHFDNKKNMASAVQHLVDTEQAPNEAAAVQMLNRYMANKGPQRFGNVERSRDINLPGYMKNEEALNRYYQGTSRRIAEAHQFGANNERIAGLVSRALKNGHNGEELQDIFDKYYNPDRTPKNAITKASSGARRILNVLQLQKAFISHLPQGFANQGSKAGFIKYAKAVGERVFKSSDRKFLDEAGFNAEKDEKASGVGRVTAPLLRQVRQFHREVAGIGGRDLAQGLADRGDEKGLRQWGVTGTLEKGEDGKITLDSNQLVQAAHAMSDRTIFADDPLQSPAWTQKELGKYVGQYRTAYTFKQAGFINNLFKDAGKGNVAPLLRYLTIGAPVSGAIVVAGKDAVTGKREKSVSQAATDIFTNSGAGAVGGGAGDDAVNNIKYDYNKDQTAQNIAGTIAPAAGTLVETGQNVDNALRGNTKPLIKQGLQYVPGGSYISNKVFPTKTTTPQQQAFNKAYSQAVQDAEKGLTPSFSKSADPAAIAKNARLRSEFAQYLARNHTDDGKSMQLSPHESMAQSGTLAADPDLLAIVQKFNKSLPDHSPEWDMSTNDLKTYEQYESEANGEKSRTVLEQQNPWLATTFSNIQEWETKQVDSGTSVKPPDFVAYPTISGNQQDLMNQVTQITAIPTANRTADQVQQLKTLESNPDLQGAYALLDNYTNAERQAKGFSPIPYPAQLTPAQEALYNQYNALPSKTGARSQFIQNNQAAWSGIENVLAQSSLFNVESQGAIAYEGGQANTQSLLGDISNLGKYDIASTSNGNGSTSYQLNPDAAYAQNSASSSSSSYKPLVALPKRPKAHIQKAAFIRRVSVKRPKIKKTNRVQVRSKGQLKPAHIGHPSGPLKIG